MEHDIKTKTFIDKAIIVHGYDKYDYIKSTYINNSTKITIICKVHGEYTQNPSDHLAGKGCRECGTITCSEKNKLTCDQFIELAIKKHGNIYSYIKVNYINNKTKIIIICHTHGEFKQIPSHHLHGHGCIKCSNTIKFTSDKFTTNKFIDAAIKKHGDVYIYTSVNYINRSTKVIIICKYHGEFTQTPYSHLAGRGCTKCGNFKRGQKLQMTCAEFTDRATQIHNNRYNYEKINYVGAHIKIEIICNIHGIFKQTPNSHLLGNGCNKCGIDSSKQKQQMTRDEFINRSTHIYGTNIYDYSQINYINNHTKISIICNHHGLFEVTPNNHLYSRSACSICYLCPNCLLWRTRGELCAYCQPLSTNKLYQKTKEMAIVKFLKDNLPHNDFIHNKSVGSDCTNGHLFPDIRFECSTYNLIVEIDEHQHRGADYKCDKQRMYDIIGKLGMPCIFIRYNPDNANSDKNQLLSMVQQYLNLDINKKIWDDYGFKVEYLFYKDIIKYDNIPINTINKSNNKKIIIKSKKNIQ
jgi:hypothetical protein